MRKKYIVRLSTTKQFRKVSAHRKSCGL